MIVHGDRQHALGLRLADDIIIQHFADFARRRNAFLALHERGFVLLADNVHAELDAFIADENSRARDELADLVLALAAERAVERVLRVACADLAHHHLRYDEADQNTGLVRIIPRCASLTKRSRRYRKTCHFGEGPLSKTGSLLDQMQPCERAPIKAGPVSRPVPPRPQSSSL